MHVKASKFYVHGMWFVVAKYNAIQSAADLAETPPNGLWKTLLWDLYETMLFTSCIKVHRFL